MAAYGDLKNRRRKDYGYVLEYRTRWYVKDWVFTELANAISRSDNDMYDHMNNSIYNFLYDLFKARLQTHSFL
jgi:acyl-CoA thioester hydrolase